MTLNEPVRRIRFSHWVEGGTGVTNIGSDAEQRCARYIQAALNLGLNGITVINRNMHGGEGWSLHDCRPGGMTGLDAFWNEVRRLGGY